MPNTKPRGSVYQFYASNMGARARRSVPVNPIPNPDPNPNQAQQMSMKEA